jgi:serine/threonine protein kinase
MAESEPKPRLIELVAPGAGQGWKAVLKNGKPAVIHEIPVPAAEAAAAIPRIQRLAEHRHPALSPVLAWGTDPNGIWVAVEPNEGTPLSTILSRGPLTPPAAAALGTAVLSGVAALHEAGVAMGGFGASAIRVTGNGEVRLAGHPAAAVRGAPAQSDLRADVRSCGMAVCAAFGVDPAGAPAPPNIPPGLVVTMRSMASGAMGPAADRAQAALREMASAMLAPDRMVAAQSELALRAGGREMPSVTPFLPKEQGAAPAPPPPVPAPPPAPIPTPYVPPVPREETPIRAPVSYDAPPRAMQTYPSIPAPTFTAPPQPPAPAPAPPAQEPTPSPVPTWSEAPPRTPSYETPAAAATTTNPPAPAQDEAPAAPPPFVPLTRSSFETAAPAASSTNPPMAAPPAAPPAAPSPAPPAPEPAQQTWTPMETPVWKPGGAAPPAEMVTAAPVAPPPEAPPLRAPISAPARKPTVARRPAGGGTSNRPSWLIPAIIAVVLILLLGTAGGIILASRNGSNGGPVGQTSPSPGATTSPRTSPNVTPSAQGGPRAVPTYAPAAADPIKSLQYCSPSTPCNISGQPPETATSCDLGAACHVEVAIAFSSPQRTAVGFSLKFFDRCTGVTTDLPGPNPFTPPGYTLVILDKNVTLPSGVKSGALVAVSTTPAVAASPALLLGSTTSCA